MKIRLVRTRRRIRIVWRGLAAIYERDRNLRQIAGKVWFVATREGLIGLKQWLAQTEPAIDHPAPQSVAEPVAVAPLPYKRWLERFDPLQRDIQAAQRHLASLR